MELQSPLEIIAWKKYETSLKMSEKLMSLNENLTSLLKLNECDGIVMRKYDKKWEMSETPLKLRNLKKIYKRIFILFQDYSFVFMH